MPNPCHDEKIGRDFEGGRAVYKPMSSQAWARLEKARPALDRELIAIQSKHEKALNAKLRGIR